MFTRNFTSDKRGVSNTLGYAVTFALIIAAVLFIFASGFGTLSEVRDSSQNNNAVRAFDILTNNIEDVYRWGAPSRATELKLAGGSVNIGSAAETTISIEVRNPETGETFSTTKTSNPLVFDTNKGTKAIYDAGMLIRSDNGNALYIEEPPYLFSPNRTGLTILETRGDAQVGGSSTTLVIASRTNSDFINQTATLQSNDKVYVNITTDAPPSRLRAWDSYYQDQGLTPIDSTYADGSITYQYRTHRVYLRSVVIEMEFENT